MNLRDYFTIKWWDMMNNAMLKEKDIISHIHIYNVENITYLNPFLYGIYECLNIDVEENDNLINNTIYHYLIEESLYKEGINNLLNNTEDVMDEITSYLVEECRYSIKNWNLYLISNGKYYLKFRHYCKKFINLMHNDILCNTLDINNNILSYPFNTDLAGKFSIENIILEPNSYLLIIKHYIRMVGYEKK